MQPLWKTAWRFLRKRKVELLYDPAAPLLGIHQDKTITQGDACSPTFTAALLTTAKTWTQPKCPLTHEWMNKTWCTYTTEYHSAIKKNEVIPLAVTWMQHEIIILSEGSQKEKDKYHTISLTCGI